MSTETFLLFLSSIILSGFSLILNLKSVKSMPTRLFSFLTMALGLGSGLYILLISLLTI